MTQQNVSNKVTPPARQEPFSVEYLVMMLQQDGIGVPAPGHEPTWYLAVARGQMEDLARRHTLWHPAKEFPYYIATRVVTEWTKDPSGNNGHMTMISLNDAVALNVIRTKPENEN